MQVSLIDQRVTIPIDRAVAQCYLYYIMWWINTLKGDNLPLLWYLGNGQCYQIVIVIKGIKGVRRTRIFNQLSVQWNFFVPIPFTLRLVITLRLVSLWVCPEHTLLPNTLPNTQHTLQEAALWPRDFRRLPYSQGIATTVHTQHTLASGTGIPMVPSIHSIQEGPRGHIDYKTRLHSQPT